VKDAFHEYVVHGRNDAVNPQNIGTKFAAHYLLEIEPGKSEVVRLRLSAADEAPLDPFAGFEEVFALRMKEADEFYAAVIPSETDDEAKKVARQGYAGGPHQLEHHGTRPDEQRCQLGIDETGLRDHGGPSWPVAA